MRIRLAQVADLEGIAHLINRNWDEVLAEVHSAAVVSRFRSEMSIAALREQLCSKTILAADDAGTVVATGALADFPSEGRAKPCISNLFVAPERQREGLGALLMQHLLALARQRSITVLHVPSSRIAVAFYTRFGFTVDTEQPDAASEMTWMRKRLSDGKA